MTTASVEERADVCGTCRFWTLPFGEKSDPAVHDGECRRYAPTSGPARSCTWPFTNKLEWCGEHEGAESAHSHETRENT